MNSTFKDVCEIKHSEYKRIYVLYITRTMTWLSKQNMYDTVDVISLKKYHVFLSKAHMSLLIVSNGMINKPL